MEPDEPIARRVCRNHRLNRKPKNQERLNEAGAGGGGEEDSRRPSNQSPPPPMVAISLYRGNLHRVSDAPRRWALPPRAISIPHFKLLLGKRSIALARLAAAVAKEEEEETKKVKEEAATASPAAAPITSSSDPQVSSVVPKNEEWKEDDEGKDRQVAVESGKVDSSELNPSADLGNSGSAAAAMDVKFEKGTTAVNGGAKDAMNKEERKRELEKKLHVLNEKKHGLVQMLKQILNAEEEIKQRNVQSSVLRASIPTQAETVGEIGSLARQPPKLSVEVNFGDDASGELDGTANHITQARQPQQLHNISPAASLSRSPFSPFQHNIGTPMSRISFPATGHGPSTSTTTGTSLSCFPTSGQQGHTSGPTPVALPNSHYTASSPSPASSSVGASSVFRDPRLSNS